VTGAATMSRWERIVRSPAEEIDLAEGALVIAADEYGDLDVDAYMHRVEEMGATLRRRLRSDISTSEAILALNRYLFDELGFAANTGEYYDPRNSYFNQVMDRRLGIPITLSLVYIETGRRIGLSLHGISFPGHFLVKCVVRDGAIVLDPYARGVSLSLEDLQQRFKAAHDGVEPGPAVIKGILAAANPKDILARLLRNLKAIYVQRADQMRALSASNRIIALLPADADEYRDRGQLYLDLECFRAALVDFETYLSLDPHARDADSVRGRIGELQSIAARLN
jgi:regulator of sirC expression with transglutaminase-like and TPR domain